MSNEENNKLAKPNKLTFGTGKGFGLSGRIAEKKKFLESIDVNTLPNRLGLIFDDSGSMSGEPIRKAAEAVDVFCKTCNPADTAIAFNSMNKVNQKLSNDFMQISIMAASLNATNGTPMYKSLFNVLQEPITRAVVFSDGSPGYHDYVTENGAMVAIDFEGIVERYVSKKVPIDTVFIGESSDHGYKLMEDLANKTGGIFLHFTDASTLAKGLKYLAPAYRALLANAEIKEKVQKGEMTI